MSVLPLEIPEPPEAPPLRTEREMLDMLRIRYGQRHGNGQRYAVAEHVKSAGAFDQHRTADMIVMDLWKTGGYSLHGHEVKVSRSDWLREKRDPEKAAEFVRFVNYWWIVVPDRRLVRDEEIPHGWGLLVLRGQALEAAVKAVRHDALAMPPSRLAALLRAVQKTAAGRAS